MFFFFVLFHCLLTEPIGHEQIVKTSAHPSEARILNDIRLRVSISDNFRTNEQVNSASTEKNRNSNQRMEFLMPQAPVVRSSQPLMSRKNGGGFLSGNDIKENLHQLQTNHKMTKKQLKLAQAQLDKLTQINIHLHGIKQMQFLFFFFYFYFCFFFFFFVIQFHLI